MNFCYFFLFVSIAAAQRELLFKKIAADFKRRGLCRALNKTVSVYFHKDDFRFFPDDTEQCSDYCKLVGDQSKANMILWHVVTQGMPTRSHPKQVIGSLGIEPFYNLKKYRNTTDFTSSYAYENDVIYPYLEGFFYSDIEKARPPTEEQFKKMKTAVFLSSNCGVPERMNFVSRLMKLVPIDSKGGCLNNSPAVHGHWTRIKDNLYDQYKFYISVEKTKEDGYVSEKFENGFLVNSIPVYFGPKQSEDIINPGAYIHIESLQDADSVAKQINRIANNYTEWLSLYNMRKQSFYRGEEVRKWIEYIKHARGRRDRGNLCRYCDFYCDKFSSH